MAFQLVLQFTHTHFVEHLFFKAELSFFVHKTKKEQYEMKKKLK